jgi:hypothetical protein
MSSQEQLSDTSWSHSAFPYLGVICMAVTLFLFSSPAASAANQAFCNQPLARDYLKPLRKMVPIDRAPEGGSLPFGPRALSLYPVGNGLRAGRGVVGFSFADAAGDQLRRVGWMLRASLLEVDRDGEVKRVLASRTRRLQRQIVNRLGTAKFVVPGKPAFYRVDIVIAQNGGQRLGAYSEYFRALPRTIDIQLALSQQEVSPGQAVYARVENLGTGMVLPSSVAKIEQYDGTDWRPIGSSVAAGLRPSLRPKILGGEIGPCFRFNASQLPSGSYRFTEQVNIPIAKSSRTTRAAFSVIAGE